MKSSFTLKKCFRLKPDAGRRTAHPRLVKRIVEDASWADVDWIQHLWAGLLVGSCSVGDPDESNLPFIHKLSQLATAHARIFVAACSRAKKFMSAPGEVSARSLSCSADELMRIAGSHDLIKIDRDLEHLADLGLLTRRRKFKFFSLIEDADITPTQLGLQLFARCYGHQGSVENFYDLDSTDKANALNRHEVFRRMRSPEGMGAVSVHIL